VKGTSKTDRLRNDIRTEIGIFSLNENIYTEENREKWKQKLPRMGGARISKQAGVINEAGTG
jgi:hypothetical protein